MSNLKAEVYSCKFNNLSNNIESTKALIKHRLALANAISYNQQKKITNLSDFKLKSINTYISEVKKTKQNEIAKSNIVYKNSINLISKRKLVSYISNIKYSL